MWHHLLFKFGPPLFLAGVVLAETTATFTDRWSPLLQLGAIGCVLAWFILQATPLMKSLVAAVDRSTRATMIAVISMHGVPDYVKEQAKGIIAEIDLKK